MGIVLPGWPVVVGSRNEAYCFEAKTLFARFTAPPSRKYKRAIDKLIRSLKSAGAWAKLDVLYVMAAADEQSARLNWIANLYNLTAVNAPTLTAGQGFAGNGTSSYHDTGYAPGVSAGLATQNDNHLGAWTQSTNATSAIDVGNTNCAINAYTGTTWSGRSMNSTAVGFATVATAIGHHVVNRSASGAAAGYRDGALDSSQSSTSAAPVSATLYIGARNNAGTPASYTSRRQAVVHAGSALTGGEIAAMQAAFAAYLTAVA